MKLPGFLVVGLVAAGTLTVGINVPLADDPQGFTRGEEAPPNAFSTFYFPPEEFEAGSVAFLVELGTNPKTIIHNWHQYQRGASGSSPDHGASFLVPVSTFKENYDLKPTDIHETTDRSEWGHSYRLDQLHGTAHLFGLRAGDAQLYVNPNDNEDPRWKQIDPPANYFDEGKPLEQGLYWWVFTATKPHIVEFEITNARSLDGPIVFDSHELRAFSNKDFESESSVSTHPVPGVGAYATMESSTRIRVDGPSYAFAQVIHHNTTPPEFSLFDPSGSPVEMRQKIFAVEGIFFGVNGVGGGVGANLTVPQADVLRPDGGEWVVEVGSSAGPRFEFILYVLDLDELMQRALG